jgi:hypothetical protein
MEVPDMEPNSVHAAAQQAASRLLLLDEHQLYEELAVRVRVIVLEPQVAGDFNLDVTTQARSMGLPQHLRGAGKYLFDRLSRPAFDLVFGSSLGEAGDRSGIAAAFGSGEAAVAGAIAEGLVASWGIAPAVAAVAGALSVKLFFESDPKAMCDGWKKRVPSRRATERGA